MKRRSRFWIAGGTVVAFVLALGVALPASATAAVPLAWERGTQAVADPAPGWYSSLVVDDQGVAHVAYRQSASGDVIRYARSDDDGATWHTSPQIPLPAGAQTGYLLSLALDGDGNPHVAFSVRIPPAISGDPATYEMRVASWNSATSSWDVSTVQSVTGHWTGLWPSLAMAGDTPHLSYIDCTGVTGSPSYSSSRGCAAGGNLMYATLVGGVWTPVQIDPQTPPDPADPVNATGYTSLALDGGGVPHIAYYDSSGSQLKYASPGAGGSWSFAVVVSPASPELSLDFYGNLPRIAYDARFARWNGTSWEIITALPGAGGTPSLAVDGDDVAYIAYRANSRTWVGSLDGNIWQIQRAGDTGLGTNDWYPSLALGPDGLPRVTYFVQVTGTTGPIMYAYSSPAAAIDVQKLVSADGGLTWQEADAAPGPLLVEGTSAQFKLVVTNTGAAALSGLVLADPDLDLSTCTLPATLAAGGTFECVVTAPWSAGQHEDEATATGNATSTYYELPSTTAKTLTTTVSDADLAHFWGGPTNAVTGSSLYTFDRDPADGSQFRLLFTPDPANVSTYKATATNPGQFYFNVFYVGTPGTEITLSLEVPYPFVTQGATPIHAYSGVTVDPSGDFPCFVPTGEFFSDSTQLELGDPGISQTIPVTLTVPESGIVYLNIHLDYGLKKTGGYAQLADGTADGTVDIANLTPYAFGVTGGQTGTSTVQNLNAFKKNPGVAGLTLSAATGDPVAGLGVQLKNPKGVIVATAITDEDGFYRIGYKHRGKAATYTVVAGGVQKSVTLKANAFVQVDFELG